MCVFLEILRLFIIHYCRHAIVEELAGFGATIYTCSRNESELNERLREWEAKGFKVKGSACDLASKTQREQLIQRVSQEFNGKLNILVNSIPFYQKTFW